MHGYLSEHHSFGETAEKLKKHHWKVAQFVFIHRFNMRGLVWNLLGVEQHPEESKKKLGIIALLYFIQGAPAAILWEVLPVYLRLHGVPLRMIGGLRLLELPYSLKFFWSPLVHRYGDRRFWVLTCMAGIAGVLFSLPFLDVAGIGWIVLLFILGLTTLSATQDVAIDSYSVGFIQREEEGAANGVRASAYRVALVVFGGGMVFLAAALTWNVLFMVAGTLFVMLGLSVAAIPPLGLPEEAREHWLRGFLGWAGTWRVLPLILFVLTYRLGEFAIGPMVKPFWVDYGKSIWPIRDDLMFQIGLFPTTFGIVLSVVGALIGGSFISRYGIFHGIWFLGLLQAASNLGYSCVDWLNLGRFGLYGASMFESLCGGLGTAAFLAFLMNVCQKEHATVQYAFLSSVFSLTGRLIGGISGLGAERYGYGNYFALTFLLSLPAYLFLPWAKDWIQEDD
jgi:MFS transporter, PAT family, beta-lactamase induction signal transducer AmpG